MVLHNDLLQTRAKILHLIILTAVLAAILNLTKRSTEVIPFFAMNLGNTFPMPNTMPNLKDWRFVSRQFLLLEYMYIVVNQTHN